MIRGGHNFNQLCILDKKVGSIESKLDGIVALDEETIKIHKSELKKNGFIISFKSFPELGRNLNVALAGALVRVLGIDKKVLVEQVRGELGEEAVKAVESGCNCEKEKFKLKKLNNKIEIMTGSLGVALGAINSGINIYLAYPMTPATALMNELAARQLEKGFMVYQPESEIAVVNMALGASFAGAKVFVGTSGGGYDLMTEAFSFQGQSEIPLVVYLASRGSNSTGLPTYTGQGDLDAALRGGHGEYARVVIAPGDAIECVEKTNEAFYLSEKFNCLSIILADKHLAESEFSSDRKPNKTLNVEVKRKVPGEAIVKANSYEHDKFGNTTESASITAKNAEERVKKYEEIKKQVKKFQMIKVYGKKDSKNLIMGWGSNKTVILDAIEGLDCKFLHVIYMKPMSDEIKKEIEKAKKVVIIESNVSGLLSRLIREKTGIKINQRILKYDGRPFFSDELNAELKKVLR